MKKIILSSLCFLTFSAHGAMTDEALMRECTPAGETAVHASRARQAGVSKEVFYADAKKKYGTDYTWVYREGVIDVAFKAPIKATPEAKGKITREIFDHAFATCIEFNRELGR
ncbi:hypothetical protein [Acinetobacter sp. YH16053]|uniref:hypothetical protein n=1 Tax=Acinetobacter sp. YH16053 TaxID=2601192 RepID=UPI0015D0EE40|nr:hypothetical protein [Acinetobacter sp. YH16053]